MAGCRRNPRISNRLGRPASARGVARRSRTRLRVRHAPCALRASPLGPARPRGFMKPVLVYLTRVVGTSRLRYGFMAIIPCYTYLEGACCDPRETCCDR